MSAAIVTELDDRWIVETRTSTVRELSALPNALRIELDSGLLIEVAGPWRATAGSPITGPDIACSDVDGWTGGAILSCVLFASGSIRIVLSTGVTIVARAEGMTRIAATLGDRLSWTSDARGVTKWFRDTASGR